MFKRRILTEDQPDSDNYQQIIIEDQPDYYQIINQILKIITNATISEPTKTILKHVKDQIIAINYQVFI